MFQQDVEDTGPVTGSGHGLRLFLVPPLSRNEFKEISPRLKEVSGRDLMFYMTRSYEALIYSDGGD